MEYEGAIHHDLLRTAVRTAPGPDRRPSAGLLGSRSVKSDSRLLVDTLGLVLAVHDFEGERGRPACSVRRRAGHTQNTHDGSGATPTPTRETRILPHEVEDATAGSSATARPTNPAPRPWSTLP